MKEKIQEEKRERVREREEGIKKRTVHWVNNRPWLFGLVIGNSRTVEQVDVL